MWQVGLVALSIAVSCCAARQAKLEGGPKPSHLCGSEIIGVEGILGSHSIVLLGELHGTNAAPRFIADLACLGVTRGNRVLIGLEIPDTEQAAIDGFLRLPSRSSQLCRADR